MSGFSNDLELWIAKCEGYRKYPYKDTVGKLTIGFGRNLDSRGLSKDEALYLMRNDIKKCQEELEKFPWYSDQPFVVKDALINMAYNLGVPRLLKFKKMIKHLHEKNYVKAAEESLNSKWRIQVGKRADDVAIMIRMGAFDE